MSKRKNRSSSPNLPQETLERARQEIAASNGAVKPPLPTPIEEEVEEVEEEFVLAPPPPVSPRAPRSTTRASSSARRRSEAAGGRVERNKTLDSDTIKERLANPTRMVTEAQLREEYGYVAKDLRSMGILALGLIVFMVVVAQFLQ